MAFGASIIHDPAPPADLPQESATLVEQIVQALSIASLVHSAQDTSAERVGESRLQASLSSPSRPAPLVGAPSFAQALSLPNVLQPLHSHSVPASHTAGLAVGRSTLVIPLSVDVKNPRELVEELSMLDLMRWWLVA